MVSLSAYDFSYEEKTRRGDTDKYLNVFEDGSLKKSDSIYIIDELLRSKQLYQDSLQGGKAPKMTETTAESSSQADKDK